MRVRVPSGGAASLLAERGGDLARPGDADTKRRFAAKVPVDQAVPRDDDQRTNEWLARTAQALEKAVSEASGLPDSLTVHLRVIQLALQCGDREATRLAAGRAIACMEVDYSTRGAVDPAAPHILMQAALDSNLRAQLLDHLSRLPKTPSIALARANLLLDQGRADEAASALDGIDAHSALVLRGFALIRSGDASQAISVLRRALRQYPTDGDAAAVLSCAFEQTGAHARALQYALRALRTAPGRHDISIRALNMLVDSGRIDEAQSEVEKIKALHYVDTVGFLVAQARILLAQGARVRALSLVRRAQALAARDGDVTAAAELRAQIALLDLPNADRRDKSAIVLKALKDAPESAVLVNLLADSMGRTNQAGVLCEAIETAAKSAEPSELLSARVVLAHLDLDFESAMELCFEWEASEPSNPAPPAIGLMLLGLLTDDWARAARIGRAAIIRAPRPQMLYNNAAYALALSGDPDGALDVLRKCDESYQVVATRGLAMIAKGEVLEGLRLYRRAADLSDADADRDGRVLMTIHQEMALRRLGIKSDESIAVQASSLPEPSLPGYWKTVPEFVLLNRVARRMGWPWPDAE